MLKREDFTEERIDSIIEEARRHGPFEALTRQEREDNRLEFLKTLPQDRDLCMFGYGSLIWNPAFRYIESRPARLFGFHRRFCLHLTIGRGSPEKPGLMLALDRGGSCNGIAFRIAASAIEEETRILWLREMISGAYKPQKVSLKTDIGTLEGFTFVVNRHHSRYIRGLSFEETIAGLSRGEGILGSCREYLSNTFYDLQRHGIRDRYVERLQKEIERRCRNGTAFSHTIENQT